MNPATTPVRPVAGATFRRVAARPIEGRKRKKLLALIAAYEDAGQPTRSADELAARLSWEPIQVRGLLSRLQADGLVKRTHSKRYRVVLDDGPTEQGHAGRVG